MTSAARSPSTTSNITQASTAELFESFVSRTRPQLRRYMLRVTRGTSVDACDADDLVAETYARAWQHWPTLATIERPEAWLSTVAWRLASSDWRNGRHRRELLRRWARATPTLTGSAETDDPTLDRIDLAAAMKALPDAQRGALYAYYWSGQPVAVIAETLGVPPGTVKARLFRGRAALAGLLVDVA